MHYHCITGQLIRSHANSKMFLWHLRKVSNGLQLDACNNEDECYNRSLNISNGTKYMEITSKYFKLYDPLYTDLQSEYVHTYKTSCINIQSYLTIYYYPIWFCHQQRYEKGTYLVDNGQWYVIRIIHSSHS